MELVLCEEWPAHDRLMAIESQVSGKDLALGTRRIVAVEDRKMYQLYYSLRYSVRDVNCVSYHHVAK